MSEPTVWPVAEPSARHVHGRNEYLVYDVAYAPVGAKINGVLKCGKAVCTDAGYKLKAAV